MSKLKTYNVLVKPSSAHALEEAVFIHEGVSLWGFVFSAFWLAYHRLWWQCIAVLVVMTASMQAVEAGVIDDTLDAIVNVVLGLLVALEGNDWRVGKYMRRGYQLYDVIAARDEDAAELRFMDKLERREFRALQQKQIAMQQQQPMAPAPQTPAPGTIFANRTRAGITAQLFPKKPQNS